MAKFFCPFSIFTVSIIIFIFFHHQRQLSGYVKFCVYLFIISSINPSKIISEGKKSRKTEDGEMEKKRQCNNKILFVSVDLTLL